MVLRLSLRAVPGLWLGGEISRCQGREVCADVSGGTGHLIDGRVDSFSSMYDEAGVG